MRVYQYYKDRRLDTFHEVMIQISEWKFTLSIHCGNITNVVWKNLQKLNKILVHVYQKKLVEGKQWEETFFSATTRQRSIK
jgi:hypothetical protein